jgi:putative oxidoreductase
MLAAAFLRHAADPFARKELALLYGFVALMFLLIGSGRYGIDALLRYRKK